MSPRHLRWYIAASVTSLALLAFNSNGASLVNAAWIPLAIGITGAVTTGGARRIGASRMQFAINPLRACRYVAVVEIVSDIGMSLDHLRNSVRQPTIQIRLNASATRTCREAA